MIFAKEAQKVVSLDLRKNRGEEQVICPICSHTRKKSKDKCLSWNHDEQVGKCHHCDESFYMKQQKEHKWEKPPQEWQNHTDLSDNLVKWFKSRGISQQTLIDCKITEEKVYFPQKQREMNAVVFNYFENGELVNKKYRSGDKDFTQTKGAKKTFYGIDDIGKEVYIVEGEMDKLAMWEAGIKSCISVPNGANDVNDIFDAAPHLNDLESIIIAVDMDEPGKKLEEELIKRFGKWRCKRAEFKGKDANDDLVSGVLIETLTSLKEYPVDGTYEAKDFKDDILNLYDNGYEETIKPKQARWNEWNSIFSILRGQLTVVTGIPSHGKSEFVEDYIFSLINDCNLKCSVYSPEHEPIQYHIARSCSKISGKPLFGADRMSKTELVRSEEWLNGKAFYTRPEGRVGWERLMDIFKQQMFQYGVDIFLVDAFNKVLRKDPDSRGEIEMVLSMLTKFVQDYNVHLFLVAHPTKMRKKEDGTYAAPTLYDVKGTSDFRDQAHNGICVYRDFGDENSEGYTEITNLKTKFSHQGDIGRSVRMKFHKGSARYYDFGFSGQPKAYFKVESQTVMPKNDLFLDDEEDDDLPF